MRRSLIDVEGEMGKNDLASQNNCYHTTISTLFLLKQISRKRYIIFFILTYTITTTNYYFKIKTSAIKSIYMLVLQLRRI